jgi:hypothetical protein
MSMYSQLLASALAVDEPSDEEPTTSAALSQLRRSRSRLGGSRQARSATETRYDTLVDHLAYDAALIKLAWLLGVDCGAEDYDMPETARARLEKVLSSRGLVWDEIEPPTKETERVATEADGP